MIHLIGIVLLLGALAYLWMSGYWKGDLDRRLMWISGCMALVIYIYCHGMLIFTLGPGGDYLFQMMMVTLLLVLSLHDARTLMLPLDLLVFGAVYGIGMTLVFGWDGMLNAMLFSLMAFVMTWGCSKVLRGGIGIGDAWIVGLLVLYLGWSQALVIILIALLLLAVTGIVMIGTGIGSKKTVLPMVPFVALSYWIVLIGMWGGI